MRRRVVLVLATAAAVLAVGWAFLLRPGAPVASRIAGEERRDERPEELPGLAAPEQGGSGDARGPAPASRSASSDDAPGDESPADEAIPLRLVTVDAATGVPVASTWNLGTGDVVAAPFSPGQVVDEAAIRASEEGVRGSIAKWEAEFLPSGTARPEALSSYNTGFPYFLTLTVRPGPGRVPPEREVAVTGPLAAGARESVAIVPIHREAPLQVRVLGPDGRPAVGAVLCAVEAAGRVLGVPAEDLEPGSFRVRGIPHMVGEPVRLLVEWGESEPTEEVPPTPQEGVGSPTVESVVPEDLTRPWALVVQLAGPTPQTILDHTEVDHDNPFEEDLLPEGEGPVGTARVRVLGWDGGPVRGASVFGQPTDRDGVVLLTRLPRGEIRFRTQSDGRFPAQAVAVVREGQETEVVLREPVGATLDVLVTDEDGAPRPSALVTIIGARVFDVVEGVQRLDRFTDARGRRTFARVEPGEVTVTATWGSRNGTERVTLRDEERTSVRIVAK